MEFVEIMFCSTRFLGQIGLTSQLFVVVEQKVFESNVGISRVEPVSIETTNLALS